MGESVNKIGYVRHTDDGTIIINSKMGYVYAPVVIYNKTMIGKGFTIGHNSVIRELCEIGDNFKMWNNSVVDYGCKIGNNVKIHCNCYLAQYTLVEDDVFIGPGVVTCNDKYPQNPKDLKGPILMKGCKIGANSTILPGVVIGENILIGAGSVVTSDIIESEGKKIKYACGNPARIVYEADNISDSAKL